MPFTWAGENMKRVMSIVILSVLVLTMVPTGSLAAMDVGDMTADFYDDSVDAVLPAIVDFVYMGGNPVVLTLDCEVDDNDNQYNITVLITFWGQLYNGIDPVPGGFRLDQWENPSAPNSDHTSMWPLGRTATKELKLDFGSGNSGLRIVCGLTATIYSVGLDESDFEAVYFDVQIP